MAYETIDHDPLSPSPRRRPAPRRSRRPSWFELVLVAGFILCLAIGGGALALLFWMRAPVQAIDAGAPAGRALQAERISPALALMQLAGDPPQALATQALVAGHLDTAFAIAVYSLELPDPARQTLLQQVGRGFADGNRPPEAAIALHAAAALAVLAPQVAPLERHQSLLAIAGSLLAVGRADLAQDVLAQALASAVHTPDLLPAQRAQVFEAVRPLAQTAGNDLLAAQASEYARNPFLVPPGRPLPLQQSHLPEPPPLDPRVVDAVAQREFAARLLAERIRLTGGVDIEPEQQALAAALLAEDAVRGEIFRASLGSQSITPAERLGFLLEWRIWLAHKARIAQRGFGLALVPEWETQAEFILQDLSAAHESIATLVEAMSNFIDDPVLQNALRMEIGLELARHAALGLHPNALPQDIGERLRVVQAELARLDHPLALAVVYQPGRMPEFRLAGP